MTRLQRGGSDLIEEPALFQALQEKSRNIDRRFSPTPYWKPYQEAIALEIATRGLRDIRRRRGSVLAKPIAIEEPWRSYSTGSLPRRLVRRAFTWWFEYLVEKGYGVLPYGHTLSSFHELGFDLASLYGELCGAVPLHSLEDSRIGNPDPVFVVGGKAYTHSFLYFYCRYATAARHIEFANLRTYVEVGGGLGIQSEILRRAHPHLKLVLIDLFTQTYMQTCYLRTAFGKAVACGNVAADIACVPNWEVDRIPDWERPALLWNAASFGEMEPETVQMYVDATRARVDAVYLFQLMAGKELSVDGSHGVVRQTRLENYDAYIGPEFRRIARQPYFPGISAYNRTALRGYEEIVWVRLPGSEKLLRARAASRSELS